MDHARKPVEHAAGSPEAEDSARAGALIRTSYESLGRDARIELGESFLAP
jgi:hypothetical protein